MKQVSKETQRVADTQAILLFHKTSQRDFLEEKEWAVADEDLENGGDGIA